MLSLRKILAFLCISASLVSMAAPSKGTGKNWEMIKNEPPHAKSVVKETDIEIMSAPSLIVISVNKTTHIEIFSILGRLVSSEILQPGISQFSINSHGVYIVKAGEITCKVVI